MPDTTMYGPHLKIERANHHIAELERIFSRYLASNIEAMRREQNSQLGKGLSAEMGIPIEKMTPAIIGDAIHNIRVSLDHAYWIMVENNKGVWHSRIKFPFFGDRPSAEAALKGQPDCHKPRPDVVTFIFNEVQPFPGGKLALYDLHRLDITDKHQLLLPTKLKLSWGRGSNLVLHGVQGGTVTFTSPDADGASIIRDTKDFGALVTNGWGPIEYTGDLQNALTILFGDGPLETRPVLDTLRILSQNALGCIKSLETMLI